MNTHPFENGLYRCQKTGRFTKSTFSYQGGDWICRHCSPLRPLIARDLKRERADAQRIAR